MIFDKNKLNMACNETIEIIMHMEDDLRKKIPLQMIKFLRRNRVEGYKTNIDFSKNILEQDILFETKSIIAIIYRDYIATPEKKKELIEWDKQYELRLEEKKREKYNPDNIFKTHKQEQKIQENIIENELTMVEYKESIFKRFINKIKKIFHIN